MLEKSAFARPYAEAAFAQAQDENDLGNWSGMLQHLSTVASDPQIKMLIDNPRVGSGKIEALVLDLCAGHLNRTRTNFVRILLDSGRFIYATQICELFEMLRANAEGVLEVEVISAFQMDEGQVSKIVDAMKQRYGKKIEISTRVDETLIGGIIIRAGDSVIDASLSGSLRQLRQEFA